jgi:dolichol-phosphate mannosyltransferase
VTTTEDNIVAITTASTHRPAELTEEITVVEPGKAAWFTVVVPTRNQADSVGPLLERLRASMGSALGEVLFVDDSSDGTPDAIRASARTSGLAVRLLHRPVGQRHGGLGGAVMEGLRQARGTWAVVMDGDLQHPPELAPRMVAVGQSRQVDVVAGSRNLAAGTAAGLSGPYRQAMSGATTATAEAIFPRGLARLSDPMSGFFAVRLAALDLDRLHPIGFKILLEIMVRQPRLRVAEVPFVFGVRSAGESKASRREGGRILRHMSRLRVAVMRNQIRKSSATSRTRRVLRLVAFGLVRVSRTASSLMG